MTGPVLPRRRAHPPRARLALLLLGVLSCGDDATGPARYSAALLAGTWQSSVTCPHEGYIYDYVLAVVGDAGQTAVRGSERPRACGDYSVAFPAVSASYRARGDSVRIESDVQCCTLARGAAEEFFTVTEGRFLDSNTVSVSRRGYYQAGGQPIGAAEAFTLVRR